MDIVLTNGLDGGDAKASALMPLLPCDAVHGPPFRRAIAVVLPMFMGYATLFALQYCVKELFDIADDLSSASRTFNVAVSGLYIGNLVMRLGHNALWRLPPRWRTALAMLSMIASLSVVMRLYYAAAPSLVHVAIGYALGGIGIGTFESNLFTVVTPLGPRTKMWATLGIPLGVNLVTIGSFAGFATHTLRPVWVYGIVIGALCIGLVAFASLPRAAKEGAGWTPRVAWTRRSTWAWATLAFAGGLAIDMYCVSTFSPGVLLYVFDAPTVALLPGARGVISRDAFLAAYNAATCTGAVAARIVAYRWRLPLWVPFTLLVGVVATHVLFTVTVPAVAFIAGCALFFANGGFYNTALRYIDESLPPGVNLLALSVWLFGGDLGSIAGSNLQLYVRELMLYVQS